MLQFSISPTKDMDLHDFYRAMSHYLVAHYYQKPWSILIDDSHKEQNILGKDTEALEILEKFALTYHHASHLSEALHIHQTLAIGLLKQGRAFICTCPNPSSDDRDYDCRGACSTHAKSQEEYQTLKASNAPFTLRLHKPPHSKTINDIIILDHHGDPSALFALSASQMLTSITHAIDTVQDQHTRAKIAHIHNALGYHERVEPIVLPDLAMEESVSIASLFKEGFIPDAILNYLAHHLLESTKEEIFTLPDLVEWFDLDHLTSTSKPFDLERLQSINRQHLQRLDNKTLSMLFGFADSDIGALAKLYLDRCCTTNALKAKIDAIFSPKKFEGAHKEQMRHLENIINNAPYFERFEDFEHHLITHANLTKEELTAPLKLLLTGEEESPPLSSLYPFIKSYILEVAS
jgi:glutamyl-tRNA synthetase